MKVAVAGLAALVMVTAPASGQAPAEPKASIVVPTAPVAAAKPGPKPAETGVTPNEQRDVSIGVINKRTGETRTFVGKPGQMFDFAGLRVTVRACEQTPPWEQKLTGAFLLIDERLLRGGMRRVYSGWMFAESPSLHPLEHPRYDVWVKSCTMRFPETGPDTVVAGRGDGSAKPLKASPNASNAKKSAPVTSAVPN